MALSEKDLTPHSWNPAVGCTKVSPGCKNCYAEAMAKWLQNMGSTDYAKGFKIHTVLNRLEEPLKRKKPTRYFVCSMSDLFHEDLNEHFIDQVMSIINQAHWHTFIILTKRAQRMSNYFLNHTPPPNAWLGVSVENPEYGYPRMKELKRINAAVRFLSVEPLLSSVKDIDLEGIDWVVLGGESGRNARIMNPVWAEEVQEKCAQRGIPFYFKQWGAWGPDGVKRSKEKNGRTLAGHEYTELPSPRSLSHTHYQDK